MIPRSDHVRRVRRLLSRNPVVAVLGARQVGKTTLARQVAGGDRAYWFDLERPADLAELAEPSSSLAPLKGLIVIDEIHRRSDLFPILRGLVDRPNSPSRFLILGSASPELLRQGSESLAGRIGFHVLPGFSIPEIGVKRSRRLWLRGGFPRSFLAPSDVDSADWREDFIATFLERDVPQFGITIPAATLRRFWTMLAHYHGQIWNASELARAFGVSNHTVTRYLDLLSALFVVRVLQPWHENVGKRLVKAPKVYLSDSGLVHALLGLKTMRDLHRHPKVGASWEGFAMEAVIAHMQARPTECFFWATHGGAELDLLIVRGTKRRAFEFKFTEAPIATRAMHIALHDLDLDRIEVIHAGKRKFPMAPRIEAVPLAQLSRVLRPL